MKHKQEKVRRPAYQAVRAAARVLVVVVCGALALLVPAVTPAGASNGVTFTSAAAATFVQNAAGTFTVTTSFSGTPPALTQTGKLPAGVTFVDNHNGTATLAGTATSAGKVYKLTVSATNPAGKVSQPFALTLDAAPVFTSKPPTSSFIVGKAGKYNIKTTGYPVATVTEVGALPQGVSFVPNAKGGGAISGTPAAHSGGTYPFTLHASNGVAPDASVNLVIAVKEPPAITSVASATFELGAQGSFSATAYMGYPGPVTWSGHGTLPTGVSFTGGSTATIAGTPYYAGPVASYPFDLTAKAGGGTATQVFTLNVVSHVGVATSSLPDGLDGQSYDAALTAGGGTGPYTWSVNSGSLPAGLSLGTDGTISGSPTAGGSSFSVQVTDANGVENWANLTIDIFQVAPTGNTLFVTTDGTDSGNCQSVTAPCASIGYALGQAGSGDQIDLGRGAFYAPQSADQGCNIPVGFDVGTSVTIVGLGEGATYTLDTENCQTQWLIGAGDGNTVTMRDMSIDSGLDGNRFLEPMDNGIFVTSGVLHLDDVYMSGFYGPALLADSEVDLTNSTVTNSSLSNWMSQYYVGTVDGEIVNLTGSTISSAVNNIALNVRGRSVIYDSTIANNPLGGISGDVDVLESTITNNGDSLRNGNGIVAGSILAKAPSHNYGPDCDGFTATDGGHNVTSDSTCGFSSANGNIANTDPNLGALTDNGGPSPTRLPNTGSPVLGIVPNGTTVDGYALCPGVDQRGVARPQGVAGSPCDAGAVEGSS